MAEREEQLQLKFRLYDGSDIGPRNYAASTTIANLKETIVAEWPQDKKFVPESVNDVKLIYSGKVLENSKTLAECKIHINELPDGVITMHVVVQPSMPKKKSGKNTDDVPKKKLCSCTII